MRWPWTKPVELPSEPPETEYRAPIVITETGTHPKVDDSLVVKEHEAEDADVEALRIAQTQTGMHRAWKKITGR